MATHSSILAWTIPWTEELGGLQSMESRRVGRDWVTNTFTVLPALSTQDPLLPFTWWPPEAVFCPLRHTLFCLRCFCNLWTDEAGCARVLTQEAAFQPVMDRGGGLLNTKASLQPSVGTTLRPVPRRPPEKTSETESPPPTVVPALSCTWSGLCSFPASTGAPRAHLPSKLFHSTLDLRTCLWEAGWRPKTTIF